MKEIESLNTFIIQDSKENVPNYFKFIPVYFVFEVKDDGRRKARLVVWDHLANPDTSKIFLGVVFIEYVRLILLLALPNDLDIRAANTVSAYLHGETCEKLHTKIDIGGKKFNREILDH